MGREKKIAALVVVYNTGCADSLTCQGLLRHIHPAITVVIYDNSTRDYGNRQFCSDHGWVYLGGEGNVGLSKAYNRGIRYLKENTDTQVMCIFDDDTHLDSGYFEILSTELKDSQDKIFVPLIYSGDTLISPCILKKGHRILLMRDEEQALSYVGQKMSAINSCMALDLSLFDDYEYDEQIFLDGIDHHFVSDMRERNHQIHVIPYRCRHSFSGDSRPSKEAALFRFGIFVKDFRYILRDHKLTYIFLVGKRLIHLIFRYKSLDFLRKL